MNKSRFGKNEANCAVAQINKQKLVGLIVYFYYCYPYYKQKKCYFTYYFLHFIIIQIVFCYSIILLK